MILDPKFWACVFGGALVFWRLPVRFRPWLIVLLSSAYLWTLSPGSLALCLALGSAAFFLAPVAASRPKLRQRIVGALLTCLLGALAFWKYGPTAARAVAPDSWFAQLGLPVGLSFYVFRLIHYVLEVSRGTIRDRDAGSFFCYLLLLPIFTAGPIEQYEHYSRNLEREFSRQSLAEGLLRIVQGLFKKLVLADTLLSEILQGQPVPANMVNSVGSFSIAKTWGFLAVFYLYNYLDFAGYSDIAIGTSRLFGINISENFNWPLLARNVGEFWKRWHMTLAGWTQRYVYMPLIARTRNPFIAVYGTFLAMGMWHASNLSYLCWGLYHGTGVAVALSWARYRRERGWTNTPPGILRYWGVPVTFAFLCGSSIFSATSGLGTAALGRLAAHAFGLR